MYIVRKKSHQVHITNRTSPGRKYGECKQTRRATSISGLTLRNTTPLYKSGANFVLQVLHGSTNQGKPP